MAEPLPVDSRCERGGQGVSEARPLVHRTGADSPEQDRAFAMAKFVWSRLEGVGMAGSDPNALGITAINAVLLTRPTSCRIRLELGRHSWLASIDGVPTEAGIAWEGYLDLLDEALVQKHPAAIKLSAQKAVVAEGERTQLEVVAGMRCENQVGLKRWETWPTKFILTRTFGPSGKKGFCIVQRYFSEAWITGSTPLPGGTGSRCLFYAASSSRNRGAELKSVPEAWPQELEAQFATRIPIKALTPPEWRGVVDTPFTEADVMTEDR